MATTAPPSPTTSPRDDDRRALFDSATYQVGTPHDVIDRLRAAGPVVWVPEPAIDGWAAGPGYWAVLSHRETRQVLRDAATYSSHRGGTQLRDPATPEDLAFVQQMMLNQDPPEHNRLRGLLSSAFVPRAIAAIEAETRHRAHRLVAAVADRGQADLVTEVVGDLPVAVLAEILGVPAQDRRLLYDWANRVIGYQDPDYAISSSFDPATGTDLARQALAHRPPPNPDGSLPNPRTRAGLADLYAYANALADHKRRHPGDDIVSLLLQASHEGTVLSNEEFENLFFLFAVAGNETLRNAIPGAVLTLISHPDAYRGLAAAHQAHAQGRGPDPWPTAIEELLRFWPPVIHFRRTATRDVTLAGQPIAEGDKVVVYHVAANRDPAVFTDPHGLDLQRADNDHVSFGYGPHFCIGAHLARQQMRSMLGEIMDQLGPLALAGEPVRLRSNFQQGLKSLPVTWRVG